MKFNVMLDRVRNRLNYHISSHLFTNIVHARLDTPIISFTFDDFPKSAFRCGGQILREYEAHGTYYVAFGLMDEIREEGLQFSQKDLEELICEGHELGCHTFEHYACGTVTVNEYEADIRKNACKLEELLRGYRIRNFSYPHGMVSPVYKRSIHRLFRSLRGNHKGINSNNVDMNLLLANPLYSAKTTLDDAKALIDQNEVKQGWLIFYTHDVRSNPSRFGCTPDLFRSIVKCAFQSGARLMTIDQAVNELLGIKRDADSLSTNTFAYGQ